MKERKIIGIDPGYDRCGVAIISGGRNSPKLEFSCCIETDKRKSFVDRAGFIYKCLREIITEHEPTDASLEEIFFTQNQRTAIKVAEARGICLLAAHESKLKIGEYTPLQVKTYLTSYGKADKKQIHFVVKKILSKTHLDIENTLTKKHDDEIDAIAIALTHLYAQRK